MTFFRLSSQGRTDLAEIRHYIARDKPLAADRQIDAFFKRFHLLAQNPEHPLNRRSLARRDDKES